MTRRRAEVVAAGALALLAGTGVLDALVLLPLVLVPSVPLPQVWAQVAAIGDLLPVVTGPAVWGLICTAVALRHLRRGRANPSARVAAITLIEAGVLALLHQGATFGMNLWLSDHLPPFEGGTTALGGALLLLAPVLGVSGAVILAMPAVRRRPRPSTSA